MNIFRYIYIYMFPLHSFAQRDIYSSIRSLQFTPASRNENIKKTGKTFDASIITKQKQQLTLYKSTEKYSKRIKYLQYIEDESNFVYDPSLIRINTFYTFDNIWIHMPIKIVPVNSSYSERYVTDYVAGSTTPNEFYIQDESNNYLFYTGSGYSTLKPSIEGALIPNQYYVDFTSDKNNANTFIFKSSDFKTINNIKFTYKNNFNIVSLDIELAAGNNMLLLHNYPGTVGINVNNLPINNYTGDQYAYFNIID